MKLIEFPAVPAKPPAAQERDRQLVALRAAAPLMGRAGQHDTSDLALFRSANEPTLF